MDDDEKLIEAVRGYPCLWQVSSRAYRDITAKTNALKTIADQLGEGSPDLVEKRWKQLREKYVRVLKKTKKGKSGDEGPKIVSTWPLFEVMNFLKDTVRHKNTTTNYKRTVAPPPPPPPPSTADVQPPRTVGIHVSSVDSCDSDDGLECYSSPRYSSSVPSREIETDSVEESRATGSSTPNSTASGTSSTANKHRPVFDQRRPGKRKREAVVDEIGKQLISSIKNLEDDKASDEEGAFGDAVAARLRRLTARQKAIAYIEIDKVLLRVQYPDDLYLNPPSAPPIPYQYSSTYAPQRPPILSPPASQHLLPASQHLLPASQHLSFQPLSSQAVTAEPTTGIQDAHAEFEY